MDRFSIVSLGWLNTIHDNFTAEELLKVECIPQNREATATRQFKANAGRARKFAAKRRDELVPADQGSTIACVSGFLFNMVDRSVQLITPCAATERWPLGYWVLDQGTFATPRELRELLQTMIDKKLRAANPIRTTWPRCSPKGRARWKRSRWPASAVGGHRSRRPSPSSTTYSPRGCWTRSRRHPASP